MPQYPLHKLTTEKTITTAVREAKSLWPFLVGFGVTGYLITNVALTVTDEDIKNSRMTNPKGQH